MLLDSLKKDGRKIFKVIINHFIYQYLPSLSFLVIKQVTTVKSLTTQSRNYTPWYLRREVENICPHKTLHMLFTAALFIIANTWKQPRCPSVDEWINKLWFIQTIEYYSALKRNELSSHEKTWRNIKCILLSERSQSEKTIYGIIQTT